MRKRNYRLKRCGEAASWVNPPLKGKVLKCPREGEMICWNMFVRSGSMVEQQSDS